LRVAVLAALIAVSVAAPTWTKALAKTADKAETGMLATMEMLPSSYGFECHTERFPANFTQQSSPQSSHYVVEVTQANLALQSLGVMSIAQCEDDCLHQTNCKAYWWKQHVSPDEPLDPYDLHWKLKGDCHISTNFTAPAEDLDAKTYTRYEWNPDPHSHFCWVIQHDWSNANTYSTSSFTGVYQENCHCTACHFEYEDSQHTRRRDITECAQKCSEDDKCQTTLHDHKKQKCFYYSTLNAQNTHVPALKQEGTYNRHSSERTEFTCWYKCDTQNGCTTEAPTFAPSTATPTGEPTDTPTSQQLMSVAPTQALSTLDKFDSGSSKGSTIQLSNNDRTATTSTTQGHTWNSVYGVQTWSSGKHSWTINVTKLDNGTPNYWELAIGVANTTNWGNSVFIIQGQGYCYIQETGGASSPTSVTDGSVNFGAAYYVGDLIKIEVDFDSTPKTIKAWKNDDLQGTMASGDSEVVGTYRLAVMAGDSLDSVEILRSD